VGAVDDLRKRLDAVEQRLDSHDTNRTTAAARIRELEEYVDVVSSPLWKRCIWWAQGFYFRKVGRWYGAGDL